MNQEEDEVIEKNFENEIKIIDDKEIDMVEVYESQKKKIQRRLIEEKCVQ